MAKKFILCFLCIFAITTNYATEPTRPATTATISTDNLVGYASYPPATKTIITEALKLTQQNLTYLYGSSDPKNGGMDCSGTIYYLLHHLGLKDAPRQANEIYLWTGNHLHLVHTQDFNSNDFTNLKPGDLLFWTGTYAIKRTPPITHVMIYLGKDQQGHQLMVGASDGRTYLNKKMWGVSVFDFKLTAKNKASQFVGYSCVPGITCDEY